MGNGMNKILPGLFVGNFRDAKDPQQLEENNITHILSIHDNAKKILKDKEYLCIEAADSPDQDLTKFFPQINKFIHKARLEGGGVLVHCLAGVSRSVTVTAAYIMTVTELGWRDSLNSIRGSRSVANPNFGFQKQLQGYDTDHVVEERKRFKRMFPDNPFNDEEECRINMHCYQQFVLTGNTPTRSDYPLPHKAYQPKNGNNQKLTEEEEKVYNNTGGRHHHHHHHHHCSHHQQHHHCHHHHHHNHNNNNKDNNGNINSVDSLNNKAGDSANRIKRKSKSQDSVDEEPGESGNNDETEGEQSSTIASTTTSSTDDNTDGGGGQEGKEKKRHSALLDDL